MAALAPGTSAWQHMVTAGLRILGLTGELCFNGPKGLSEGSLHGSCHSARRSGNKKRASIEPLVKLTAPDMERVNESILSHAKSHVELIPEIASHLINSGGKRIRPMLTLAAARMCGYQGEHHLKLATAVEFMHTATLLHDDVVDESDLRRGKQAARVIWGNQASVLVGDYLLGQAFR